MQIEKLWSGLPAPQSVTSKVKRVKDTYTEDAVAFEKEKREGQSQNFEDKQPDSEPNQEDPKEEHEVAEKKVHVDVTV